MPAPTTTTSTSSSGTSPGTAGRVNAPRRRLQDAGSSASSLLERGDQTRLAPRRAGADRVEGVGRPVEPDEEASVAQEDLMATWSQALLVGLRSSSYA